MHTDASVGNTGEV